ncbi:hypothetical protein [Pokkaliibacter plantistimulans]|uniref:hypothetical protein n=1 Tax=Pokkaliibacter plantistimulans TaxID=1635171 RepID=UPI00105791F5|nr:hypothetical protein [Pokkaliibacter plantistimulans]
MEDLTNTKIKRPRHITVIGWFLIITSSYTAIRMPYLLLNHPELVKVLEQNSLPLYAQLMLSSASVIFSIIAGALILNRKKSGRTLYTSWSILSLIISTSTMPTLLPIIFGAIIPAIIIGTLLTPSSNNYFNNTKSI